MNFLGLGLACFEVPYWLAFAYVGAGFPLKK